MRTWKPLVTSLLLVVGIVALSAAPQQNASKVDPLAIQEQGSFAVGGTVVTAPGTFDPIAQGCVQPSRRRPARTDAARRSHVLSSIKCR